ncbi:asparagine:proton symporter, AAT family [Marinactinospora thermotolerans DSM 45154]|uniref:Asparagine:proton symporter, AAT family n=1 Tax=Marinactinospora thermotolerans DSM 45154 TaxID=1122192 RepID=A0A1T4TFQ0_9ACTN|nr:amino acid permease [Marinactinospora thermotolerans]SKA39313.1 asparagine:proton symporter, AAT family [Marinactinospora thermotolerans DSM 45154]
MSGQTMPRDGGTPVPPTDAGDAGYSKSLRARHINMIAIGGAIGTGLFLGAGGRLHDAGPVLALVYAVCGVFAFFVVRALGELILHRPSSGSFVSYAREFMGEKGAYAGGWLYFLNWGTTGVADITAIAMYTHYWAVFSDVPQWVLALAALAVVLAVNMISVRIFGEMEFWFAIVKVAALVAFMLVGVGLLVAGHDVGGHDSGPHLLVADGLLPNGLLPVVLVVQGIVFAYAAVELVGVAAGETAEPERIMPRAINSIMWRIGVFYVGSVLLLAMLLPHGAYTAGESPFVTVLTELGVPAADDVMNLVVLTAAMSSLNSGLYSTGRILRSMAVAGSAPRFAGVMSRSRVPYGGILMTSGVCVLGVGLNYAVPARAFEIVLNFAAIGILSTWGMIMLCHLLFWRQARAGLVERPVYRLPAAPWTTLATLGFFAVVLFLMWLDEEAGRATVMCVPVIAAGLVAGWFVVRGRVRAVAAGEREALPEPG